jgi:hypothetical protein
MSLQMQVWFYINSCLSEDLESQRFGYVFILFLHDVSLGDVDFNRGISRLLGSGLVRISGFHICSPDTRHYRAAKATVLLMLGATIRSRTRFHIGEFLFPLRTFCFCLIAVSTVAHNEHLHVFLTRLCQVPRLNVCAA